MIWYRYRPQTMMSDGCMKSFLILLVQIPSAQEVGNSVLRTRNKDSLYLKLVKQQRKSKFPLNMTEKRNHRLEPEFSTKTELLLITIENQLLSFPLVSPKFHSNNNGKKFKIIDCEVFALRIKSGNSQWK